MFRPSKASVPFVGLKLPQIMLKMVLLPAPLGPDDAKYLTPADIEGKVGHCRQPTKALA